MGRSRAGMARCWVFCATPTGWMPATACIGPLVAHVVDKMRCKFSAVTQAPTTEHGNRSAPGARSTKLQWTILTWTIGCFAGIQEVEEISKNNELVRGKPRFQSCLIRRIGGEGIGSRRVIACA